MKLKTKRKAIEGRPPGARAREKAMNARLVHPEDRALWKRVLDISCLLMAAPILAPLMLIISLGIKIVSRGPVFFQQVRIGYRGRPFRLYKFRSMEVDVNPEIHEKYMRHLMQTDAPMKKLDEASDPALISWGLFLRASGLDELPQIINVIRGEMSLVGPRPCTTYEYERYLPWHKHRLRTLPGITGLWQVSGKNKTTFTEMMHLDIAYTRQKSLWLDIKILARTLWVPVSQLREAYSAQDQCQKRAENAAYSRPIETKR